LFKVRSNSFERFLVASSPIATDDLDSRMCEEPISQNLLVAAQQNLNWSMAL